MSLAISPGEPRDRITFRWPSPVNTASLQIGDSNVHIGNAVLCTRGAVIPANFAFGFLGATGLRILSAGDSGPRLELTTGGRQCFALPWAVPVGSIGTNAFSVGVPSLRLDFDLEVSGTTADQDGVGLFFSDFFAVVDPTAGTGLGGVTIHRVAGVPFDAWELRRWLPGGVLAGTDALAGQTLASDRLGCRIELSVGRAEQLPTLRVTTQVTAGTQLAGEWAFDGVDLPAPVGNPYGLALWHNTPTIASVAWRGVCDMAFPAGDGATPPAL